MRYSSRWAGLAVLAALSSCSGGDGVADVLLVASVEVAPSSGNLVLGGTAQLTATPRTASGLVVPGRSVAWSSSNSAAVSVAQDGMITAHALGGPVRITATVDGVSGEANITVQPFPIARIEVTPQQVGVLVGGSTELVATAYDAQGQPLPDRIPFWTSSAPSIAAVTSTGIVLGMAQGGPVTITAMAEGKTGTATVMVTPRPATQVGFLQQPSPATAGRPISPAVRVAIRNDQGGTVTGATNQVTLALADNPGGATLGGATTVAAVNGVATFTDLTLDKAGTGYTLIATSGSLASATSSAFSNVAGTASQLTFTTAPPGSATSGQPLAPQPVLQLRDAFGNAVGQAGVVVTAALGSGNATLGGSTTATTSAAGTATFANLSVTGSGSVTLDFSAPGLSSAASSTITVIAAGGSTLAIVTQPSAVAQSGTPFAVQPAVEIRDASGSKVSTAGVSITATLASGPAGGSLTGGAVVQTAAGGTATFANLGITGPAGSYTLQFTSPGLSPVTSAAIVVAGAPPGPATQLSITTQPSSSATSGTAFAQQPVLQLRDAGGTAVAQSGVVVTAAIATGGGTLGGALSATTNGSGVAAFTNLSITGSAGDRTLSFSATGLTGTTSGIVSITALPPSPATQLSISTQPSTTAASGTPFATQPAIQLRDAQGAAVSQSGVPVTVSVASGSATLSGTLTVNTNSTGQATFSGLTLTGTAGAHTLRFTSPGLTDALSATINLGAGAAAKLLIVTQPPSTAKSGKDFSSDTEVRLLDASDNPVLRSGVTITATLASGIGILGGDPTENTNGSGIARFDNLKITGVGTFTLRFSGTGLTSVVSTTITVVP
ncbi:MAG TPA: Ig-like domain-containing protein [Gemmatimonadales bacterium]|nr:Ig-like domain-containing protein [Gemmatimonadales bacterium]